MNPTTDPGRTGHRAPVGSTSGDPTLIVDPDLTTLRLCAPVAVDQTINSRWCKSNRVAVADVHGGRITMDIAVHPGACRPVTTTLVAAAHEQLTR